MTTTDARPIVTCPSWCTNPAGHEQPDDGVVWHDRVVLALPLPEMRATDQLGRCGVGAIEVRIQQDINFLKPEHAMPGVMVTLTRTDYAQAVLLTDSEAVQVGSAVTDPGRLINHQLWLEEATSEYPEFVGDDRGQVAGLYGYEPLNP